MIRLFSCLLIFIHSFSFSQSNVNVYCKDFTLNDDPFEKGDDFRKIFESALLELKYPPTLVDRTRTDEIFEVIQEEKNLRYDLRQEDLTLFKALQVDFLIFGNFNFSPLTGTVDFQSESIKVSGNNGLLKIVFPVIRFSEKEFSSTITFELKVKEMLKNFSFDEKFGLVTTDAFDEIKSLFEIKDRKIEELEEKMKFMTNYLDICNLNLFGSTFYYPGKGGDIKDESLLINEMSKIFKPQNKSQANMIFKIQYTEEAIQAGLKAIEIEPRFPFSYYALAYIYHSKKNPKWIIFAQKAKEILVYTTKSEGCKNEHKDSLNKINQLLSFKKND